MKPLFISAGIGGWYPTGIDRLRGSLISHFAGDVITWKDEWPAGIHIARDCIYNVKAAAFEYAMTRGYTTIIWGDASVYAVKDTTPFVRTVTEKGFWLGSSGYNAAQTCSDAQLAYFGITRDEAEKMPDAATGLFGVNTETEIGRRFIETWIRAAKNGAFRGSRMHAGQSSDPRYLHARQDQSCASVIAGQLGMKLDTFSDYVAFRWDKGDRYTFRCEGMG